jgi:hypothetical protein
MNPNYNMNPYNPNIMSSNYNMPYQQNFNAMPGYNPNYYFNPNCNVCRGSGLYYDSNNFQRQCECGVLSTTTTTSYIPSQQIISGPNYYPYHHKGLLDKIGDVFKAVSGCGSCNGSGWVMSKYGNQTYCPSCINANGYCPKCNNTGIKWKNGKICHHNF